MRSNPIPVLESDPYRRRAPCPRVHDPHRQRRVARDLCRLNDCKQKDRAEGAAKQNATGHLPDLISSWSKLQLAMPAFLPAYLWAKPRAVFKRVTLLHNEGAATRM